MKAGDIQLHLATTNRWWRGTGWERDDPRLRAAAAAPFRYRSGALRDLTPGGLYVLRGPRRAGKSTEIAQAVGDLLDSGVPPRNIVHAAVDGWRAADLRTLVMSASMTFLAGTNGPRYWFLDEITSVVGDWPNTIKNLRDNDVGFGEDTVVLTGSSAVGLHAARRALAGRRGPATRTERVLLPMRFTDVVAARGVQPPMPAPVPVQELRSEQVSDAVSDLLPYLGDLVGLWESYLRFGGFPQAVSSWLQSGELDQPFVDALWDVVYGKAITGTRFSATQTAALLDRLARNLCSPLNVSRLADDIDAARATVADRLADLAESFLVWPCHREQGLAPRLAAQTKWYFTDPVLARLAALRGLGREPDLTQLSEQQLGMVLLRNLDAAGSGDVTDYAELLHYRSSTGTEIDFVGRRMGEIAVESKYVDDRWAREAQTLAASGWHGVIATRSVTQWRGEVWAVPAPILALILGG